MVIYSGFSHWKWWFSIAMLVYQRVYPQNMAKNVVHIWYLRGIRILEISHWSTIGSYRMSNRMSNRISMVFWRVSPHQIKFCHWWDQLNQVNIWKIRQPATCCACCAATSCAWRFPQITCVTSGFSFIQILRKLSRLKWKLTCVKFLNPKLPFSEFWLRRRKNLTLASPFVGLRGDALRPPGVTLFPGKSPISIGERIWSDPHGTSIPRLSLKPPWQHRQNGSSRTAHTEFSGAIPPGSGPTERNFHVQNLRIQGLCEASASSQERCTLCSLPDIQSMNASEDMRNGNDSYPLGIQHNITVT